MKILVGSDTYYPDVNGASYFTQRLVGGLVAAGHEVEVVAPSRDASSRTASRDGVTEHRLGSRLTPFHPEFRYCPPGGLARRVRRVVEEARPDVVHVQNHVLLGRALLAAGRDLGIPVVATNHFMPDNLTVYLRLPAALERAAMRWAWRDLARVYGRADIVTAPTPTAAAMVERHGITGPVLPISCGIDLTRFHPGADAHGFRARYGVPDRPTLLYVGRLDAEKHVDELVRALPLVRRAPGCADAQLLVVGDGHCRDELVALAASEGVAEHVLLTGFVPDEDLPGAFAAADVFCNAGRAELQSIVSLEAMASGLPVVLADAHALPHLVREGENGGLFPPGDVDLLAVHAAGLLADAPRRRRAGQRSRELAGAHDAAATIAAFEDVYAMACLGRPARRLAAVPEAAAEAGSGTAPEPGSAPGPTFEPGPEAGLAPEPEPEVGPTPEPAPAPGPERGEPAAAAAR